MYLEFFGFKERPFALVPDMNFMFKSAQYAEAYNNLLYAVREKEGLMLITGEAGTGKTTLCRAIMQRMTGAVVCVYVPHPPGDQSELLQALLAGLGAEATSGARLILVQRLEQLLRQRAARDESVVVIIDEAQHLSLEVLEEIRLLSNLETDKEKLLQVVLCGQRALQDKLAAPEMRSLKQRIVVHYHLCALDEKETDSYIRYRLMKAGTNGDVSFTAAAVQKIYRCSGGNPRLIHQICDKCLLAGYVARRKKITVAMVQEALTAVYCADDPDISAHRPGARRVFSTAASAAVLVLIGVVWLAGLEYASGGRGHELLLPEAVNAASLAPTFQDEPSAAVEASHDESSVKRDVAAGYADLDDEYADFAGDAEPGPAQAAESAFDEHGIMRTDQDIQCAREALGTLLRLWGSAESELQHDLPEPGERFSFYDAAGMFGFHVVTRMSDIGQISALNYPCIVSLDDERYRYVVLSGLDDERVVLLDPKYGRVELDAQSFSRSWTGRVFYVWKDMRPLPSALKLHDEHDEVASIKRMLNSWCGAVSKPFTTHYDESLQGAVKALQARYGLAADGIFGGLTKMAFYRLFYSEAVPSLSTAAPANDRGDVPVIADAGLPAPEQKKDADIGSGGRDALAVLLAKWDVPDEAIRAQLADWTAQSTFDEHVAPLGLRVTALRAGPSQLQRLNYPCILLLQEDKPRYAVLAECTEDAAVLVDAGGSHTELEWHALQKRWDGRAFYIWKDVDGISVGLQRGDRHADIVSIKEGLQDVGLGDGIAPGPEFDSGLEQAVKRLQQRFGLASDGIWGSRTLMAFYRLRYDARLPSLQQHGLQPIMLTRASDVDFPVLTPYGR